MTNIGRSTSSATCIKLAQLQETLENTANQLSCTLEQIARMQAAKTTEAISARREYMSKTRTNKQETK